MSERSFLFFLAILESDFQKGCYSPGCSGMTDMCFIPLS